MSQLVINDLVEELSEENQRLVNVLSIERQLIEVLDQMREKSLVLINKCKCDTNEGLIQTIHQLNRQYKTIIDSKSKGSNEVMIVKTSMTLGAVTKGKQTARKAINRYQNNNHSTATKPQDIGSVCVKQEVTGEEEVDPKLTPSGSRQLPADKNFTYFTDLLRQKSGKDTTPAAVKCPECHQLFATAVDLKDHVNAVHRNRTYHCYLCGELFPSSDQLSAHIPVCGSALQSTLQSAVQSALQSAEVVVSDDDTDGDDESVTTYRCDECHYSTTHKYRIERHASTHTDERPFQCHHCHKRLKTMGSLTNHLREVHEWKDRFRCGVCPYATSKKYNLKSHMISHKAGGSAGPTVTYPPDHPYECDVCHRHFKSEPSLTKHKKVMHAVFACAHCPYTVNIQTELQNHVTVHHSTDPLPYVCPYADCGQRFTNSYAHRQHQRSHKTRQTVSDIDLPEVVEVDVDLIQ